MKELFQYNTRNNFRVKILMINKEKALIKILVYLLEKVKLMELLEI